MPLDKTVHNVEITLKNGGQLVRVVGVVLKLIAKEGKSMIIKLPFGEICLI